MSTGTSDLPPVAGDAAAAGAGGGVLDGAGGAYAGGGVGVDDGGFTLPSTRVNSLGPAAAAGITGGE